MKTATLPAIRVEPELRDKLESVLHEGETLSSFIETTLRSAIEYRAVQNHFHARGQRSKELYEATGVSYTTDEVIDRLLAKTQRRREKILGKGK
ncbi:YlcI/YnfO family protein [Ramlibacter sp. 2FC]|uniref:YlcI/YnfO family protein n=1 Tax=Ramlibacter sp. 2FC TaxID=2502188 RepID=UPI0010F9B5B8|nr:YlcI/YnfO family protein [Ramlibacter sp. 2FC]